VIAAVLAVLLAPVVVWMLVFRQIPGPPMPTLAVPSPAAKVSAADALQKGKKAYEQKDYAEAMRWYRKAADEDNADAQNKIGALYANGWGMALDYAEAMRWFRKAADQGNAAAQNNIGFLYDKGWGVAQDYAEAMRWYQKAADQGNATAQENIRKLMIFR
jgi:TPR repeat protein